ncbi:uncharacterized protein TNCT_607531 [Trichonephila clavata]|uniref:Uncharacterized protein n=1 Tax=Trichonephila clavata TaxID=2740835 RepID=A0A8X6JYK1_TRICU|nr:uncharacterized protein TNCT_607531 [Trichonephila clavata]
MENQVDDQNVDMEDVNASNLSDEQKCAKLTRFEKQIQIFTARKDYGLALSIPQCKHNLKAKTSKKIPAEPIIRPPKLTTSVIKNPNKEITDFKLSRKTIKNAIDPAKKVNIEIKNSFAAFNSVGKDVEDVTPTAPKIRPIMMKLTPNYNLTLQDLYRSHPTAINTHSERYNKSQPEHRQEITEYLSSKKIQHYVTDLPANRPLKLVIKRLLASTNGGN